MLDTTHIQEQLFERFGQDRFTVQITADGMPTLWVARDQIVEVLGYLKT